MINKENHNWKFTPWVKLMFGSFLIWIFGWGIGPYIENNIPIYRQIATVIEERDIDSAAYMYTEETASYEGEYFLIDSFKHSKRNDFGLTLSFFSGIALCFSILWIGWRYIL